MVDAPEGGEFDSDAVGHPVGGHAQADDAAQGLVGGPHEVLLPADFAALVKIICQYLEGAHHGFGVAILHQRANRVGEVLLADMDKGVDQAVLQLAVGQAAHHIRVEEGEARAGRGDEADFLFAQRLVGDHHAGIRFRAGGRQREHDADGQGGFGEMATGDDVPTVTVVKRSGGDVLGPVGDRAAAHGEDEIKLHGAHDGHGLVQGFQRRVGFNTGELNHFSTTQRGHHFLIYAVLLDRATAVEQQHPRPRWQHTRQLGVARRPEEDLRRVMVVEVENVGHAGTPSSAMRRVCCKWCRSGR